MRRSRKAFLALALLLGLLALAFFWFPLSEGVWGMQKLVIEPADHRARYVLTPAAGAGPVYAIRVTFRGTLRGRAVVRLTPPDGEVLVRKVLREGEVEAEYRGDWYAGSCELIYEPDPGTEGSLRVYYEFDRFQ